MKKSLLTILVLLSLTSIAKAGLMIEPYGGYNLGSVSETNVTTPANSTTGSLNGTAFGGRLGYRFLIPWIALDYRSMSGKLKPNNSLVNESNASQSSLGVVVGADLPIVRVWGGYGFTNDLKLTDTVTGTTDKLSGSYTKVGLGVSFLVFVSLNVEYQMNNYTKFNGNDIKQTYSKFDNNSVLISLSLPLHL